MGILDYDRSALAKTSASGTAFLHRNPFNSSSPRMLYGTREVLTTRPGYNSVTVDTSKGGKDDITVL